jgi:RNA polymerase sigma factor (sigma-70 family)
MPHGPLNPLVRYLGNLVGTPVGSKLTDAELLRRFAREQDESAFALLVERHGRLVWAVCRHVLAHEQDAEDAFQATLLVFARKAGSIRNHRSVASFLYGVAHRTALKTRTTVARRRKYERQAEARAPEGPVSEAAMRELQAILDEEVQRLPEKFRAPFVLCCLEGKGKAEAAEELGWPEGTVSGRVAQARKLLQRRLARRGITLSAALCALAVAEGAVSAVTTVAVVKAALPFAAGKALAPGAVSAQAVTIAEAVLRAGTSSRLKLLLAVVVLLGLVGGGAGAWLKHAAANRPEDQASAEGPLPPPAEDAKAPVAGVAVADAEGDRGVTVAGRVIGPDGQPLPGAQVGVTAWQPLQPGKRNLGTPFRQNTLGAGSADGQGGFRLTLPEARPHHSVAILASCRGFGLAWRVLRDPGEADVPLQLERGQSVHGRLVDAGGTPARGAAVHVVGVTKLAVGGDLLQFPEPPSPPLPAWFPPVVTDDDGGFTLRDLGPDWTVYLEVRDDRFAFQLLTVKTGPQERAEPLAFALAPAHFLEGEVTAEDTGAPLAGVAFLATGDGAGPDLLKMARARTDAQGRFRLNPPPGGRLTLSILPPQGASYLGLQVALPWPPKLGEATHFVLPRGVRVRGRVLAAGSGKPVAGAVVSSMAYIPGNDYLRRPNQNENPKAEREAVTGADGTYELTLLPGPGHLLIKGPTPDYLHVETSDLRLLYGRPGGNPYYPDGLLAVNFKPDGGIHVLEPVVLRRGVTVEGRLVGPDGGPAGPGFVLCPTCITEGYVLSSTPLPTRAGRFELPGCDPDRSVTVWFFDPHHGLGGVEQLSARGGGERVVRLAECGSVTLHLVAPAGTQPADPVRAELALALRPPGTALNPEPAAAGPLRPAYVFRGSGLATQDPRDHSLTFPQLIPGATYVLRVDAGRGWVNLKELTVKPGEHLNLGMLIFPPPDSGRPPAKT